MLATTEARRRGDEDVLIIEKGSDFGGCWRENTYPGVACDIPSHLYSFRRNPNAGWSRTGHRWTGAARTGAEGGRLGPHQTTGCPASRWR